MRRGSLVLLVVVGVVLIAGMFVYGGKSAQNQMVQKQENVSSKWSDVDVNLQRPRRSDSQSGGDGEGLH